MLLWVHNVHKNNIIPIPLIEIKLVIMSNYYCYVKTQIIVSELGDSHTVAPDSAIRGITLA